MTEYDHAILMAATYSRRAWESLKAGDMINHKMDLAKQREYLAKARGM